MESVTVTVVENSEYRDKYTSVTSPTESNAHITCHSLSSIDDTR